MARCDQGYLCEVCGAEVEEITESDLYLAYVLGEVPGGKPVLVMGMSHLRFGGGSVVEEWTVFDEVGVLAQAYRS